MKEDFGLKIEREYSIIGKLNDKKIIFRRMQGNCKILYICVKI